MRERHPLLGELCETSHGIVIDCIMCFFGSCLFIQMVLFHLNDFYPPTVSAIEKENPRVLCDFNNMNLADGVQEDIVASGKFVKHIRAEKFKNPDKVRIVLDLSPDRDYDLQQVFFKNDNLFVLIVNELPAKKDAQ